MYILSISCFCLDHTETPSISTRDTSEENPDYDGSTVPAIVVYLVEPFTYAEHWRDYSRLATLGLLRSFHEMHSTLPSNIQPQVHLQVGSVFVCVYNIIEENIIKWSRYDIVFLASYISLPSWAN